MHGLVVRLLDGFGLLDTTLVYLNINIRIHIHWFTYVKKLDM